MLAVDDEFDYVIVGGGTAGCVLANRLSADERTRVLLLEPGPSARGALKVAVPVALVKLFNSKWDWSFTELTRTPRGLRWVRTGYAYQPPALGTYRTHRAACPQGPTYCTYWVRVPASGVPYVPRTVAPQAW